MKALTLQLSINDFRATGIAPFNSNLITDADFIVQTVNNLMK